MANKQDPEAILRKSEEEMSDIELLMADILTEEDKKNIENAVEAEESRKKAYASPVPPERTVRPEKKPRQQRAPQAFDVAEIDDILKGKAPKKEASGDMLPVSPSRTRKASEIRKADSAREKKIDEQVKKKKKSKIFPVILIICAMLVIAGIVINALMKELNERRAAVEETLAYSQSVPEEDQSAYYVEIPEDTIFPEPETEESLQKLAEEAETGIPRNDNAIVIMSTGETGEKQYNIYVEDVSWTEARDRCISIGGKLVTIASQEELNEVIALAEEAGIEKIWVGCHRENGQMVWEGNENIDFYVWGDGEPSQYDSGDHVAEDYLLLWFFRGKWVYNDSRNDPVSDYPDMYSGKIAYVCEMN